MILIFLPLLFLTFSRARYIKPYKHHALDISRPFASTPNLDFKVTFSITESEIPPSTFLIINFNNIEFFTNSNMGSPSQCKLLPFSETSGASFDPLTDLIDDSSINNPSYVSSCFSVDFAPLYIFKLNQTLKIDQIYQLSFKMLSSFQESATAIGLYFTSTINFSQSYYYCYNVIYDILIIKPLPQSFQNISLISQPRYYSQVFYDVINVALSQSLLSYSQAVLTTTDISVSSFNEMISRSKKMGFISWDQDYSPDIVNYPGFFGNLVLEIHIDQNVTPFNSWELEVPPGWILENSQCISVDFFKGNTNNTAIAHTKCTIDENNNRLLQLYNIFQIAAPLDVRINVTNVRNPIIPIQGVAKFTLFDEKNKKYIYQNLSLAGLEVKNQQLQVSFQSFDTRLTNKITLFVNKTQRIGISIKVPFFDFIGESTIIIKQNNTDNHGFIADTCVVVNTESPLSNVGSRNIDCFVNKSQLVIRNIAKISSKKLFQVFFMNKNEANSGKINFQIDIFSKDPAKNDIFYTQPSYSYNYTFDIIEESLKINDIYYKNSSGQIIFDNYEVSSTGKPVLNVIFSLPNNTKTQIMTNESLNLILNKRIKIDSSSLQCFLDNITFNCSIDQGENNFISMIFSDGNKNTLNLFDTNNHTLTIQGLSYQMTVANSYLYTFEYYLVYKSIDPTFPIYEAFKTANLSPNINTNASSSQIFILGQGGNQTVMFSFSKIKLSSEETLSYIQDTVNIESLMLKIYFQNIYHGMYSPYSDILATYPSESIIGQFVPGLNESSSSFLDWPRYEISNIQTSNGQDFFTLPLKLLLNPPIIYVQYYFVTTNNTNILYESFFKTTIEPSSVQTPDSLSIDWNATKAQYPSNSLNPRVTTPIIFAVNLSQAILQPLVASGSGFFLFLLPWLVASSDKSSLTCQFSTFQKQFPLVSNVLFDAVEEKSAIVISMSDMELFSDYNTNLVDSLTCNDLITPTSTFFLGGYGVALDGNGNIIAKSEMNMELGIFTPANLDLKRVLATPNNINFPAAHYAFYFTNDLPIEKNDYIGMGLPRQPNETDQSVYNQSHPNVGSSDFSCYVSLLPSSYKVPDSGSAFNFDENDYEVSLSQTIDLQTTSLIRLKTKTCLYAFPLVFAQLDISVTLPSNSLILFEVFGVSNPKIDKVSLFVMVVRVSDVAVDYLMNSNYNMNHYYINEESDYSNAITFDLGSFLSYKIDNFYRSPTTVTIYLSELILPNFQISILTSQSLIDANQQNQHIKSFFDVKNDNIDVKLLDYLEFFDLPDDGVQASSTNSTARILDDSTASLNTIDSNTNTNNDNSTKKYIAPTIKTYYSELSGINLTLGRPSLSQRTLKATFYNFLLPNSEDNLCITIMISVKNQTLFNETQCEGLIRATPESFNLTVVKSDIFVETVRTNLSFDIIPNFEMNGLGNFLGISFDGDTITIPDEVKIWVNNNQVFNVIYDKNIIAFLPNLPKNQTFHLVISDINAPASTTNQTGILSLGIINQDFSANISQQVFSMETTQNLGKMDVGVFIVEILPSNLNTYQISVLNFTILTMNYMPKNTDIFRVMLPNDFPPNYLVTTKLTCTLDLYTISFTLISSFKVICQMKGTVVDITIVDLLANLSYSFLFFFKISVSGIFTTPNYGVSGDFRIVIYDLNKTVLAVSYRIMDIGENPVISQNLETIKKNQDLTQGDDISIIGIRQGTIKPIILRPNSNKGFKNDLTIFLQSSGNKDVTVLNSSISVITGDQYSTVYVSVGPTAGEVVSYLLYIKSEAGSVNKYQEIYPLRISIQINDKIKINVPDSLNVFVGGRSYYIEITLSDIPNIAVNLNVTSSDTNLQIIGLSQLTFNQSKTVNRFRVSANANINISSVYFLNYSIVNGNYSNLFQLSNSYTQIKLFAKPKNLDSSTLTFIGKVQVYSKTIDIVISGFNFQTEIYYQIYRSNTLNSIEMSTQDIIDKVNNSSDYQVFLPNIIVGVFKCNDTTKACSQRIGNLLPSSYNLKCFAVSPAGIQSNYIYTKYFEPYPLKPLVLSLGFNIPLPQSIYNDLLCAFVDYFSLSPLNLYLENNKTCNSTDFNLKNYLSTIYSTATTTYQQTKQYITEISSTVSEMGLNFNKISNLNISLITSLITNIASLESFLSQSSQFSLKLFIYPPESIPLLDLSSYVNMIVDQSKISFFKARYSFLNFQIYLKAYGTLAANEDVQTIMPMFLGSPIVRTDSNTISITVELNTEGNVYAMAIPSKNYTYPTNGEQVARGVDGNGSMADQFGFSGTVLDSQGTFRPVTVKFSSLQNDLEYCIFYASGIQVPKTAMVSKNVYMVKATPTDPTKIRGKRILKGEEEFGESF